MSSESIAVPVPSGTWETKLELRWGDLDSLGHVNNSVYFQYFEEARVRLFSTAGLRDFSRRSMVQAHATCDFLKPLLYPASIVVGLKLVRIGRSSLELESWIADATDRSHVYARGSNVVVRFDVAQRHSSPWTAAELQALRACFPV